MFLVLTLYIVAFQVNTALPARRQSRSRRPWRPAGRGTSIAGLTARETEFFLLGKEDFEEEEDVPDGLGPRMNLDGCGGCHSQPAVGGTSPAVNPQVDFASKLGGTDAVPSFITLNGPVREARFIRNPDGTPDGGVPICSRSPVERALADATLPSRTSRGSSRAAT